MGEQLLNDISPYGYPFCMHRMVADGFALDGFEGASTDVQGDFATGDAALVYGL